jgi:CheY-like chemotaxis protein
MQTTIRAESERSRDVKRRERDPESSRHGDGSMTTSTANNDAGTGGSVLVVEDEDTLRCLIAQYLDRHGYAVREAASVAEAKEALCEGRTDVMVLDINLPDQTGWDVLRFLQTQRRSVRTVIVSAVRIPPRKLDEFEQVECLPKPFPLEALLRIIGRAGLSPAIQGT